LGPEEGNDFSDTLNSLMQFLINASNSLADTVQTNFEKRRRNSNKSGSLPLQTLKLNATALPGNGVGVRIIFKCKSWILIQFLPGISSTLKDVGACEALNSFELSAQSKFF
jgi:hypothetical protein